MSGKQKVIVGIDLGTSTSEVAVLKGGKPEMIPDLTNKTKSPIMPSIVALDSKNRLVVGELARRYVDMPGRGVREVKRNMATSTPVLLEGQSYRPEQISALILKKIKENAETLYGPITDVVISVPAIFEEVGKYNTMQAAKIAGLNVIELISEPTAAALAFGFNNIDLDEKLLVFDFGGGTLDISIVEMMNNVLDVAGTYGDTELGGKDFDQVLIDLILSKFYKENGKDVNVSAVSLAQLKEYAETCKIALSSENSYTIEIYNFGIKNGLPQDLVVDVTRSEFEAAASHLLDRARKCLTETLARTNTTPETITRVLLVGGTTYIPAVRNMLKEIFSCPLSMDVNPDLAVSMGAAIKAGLLQDDSNKTILIDKCPYGLGIDVCAIINGRPKLVYDPLSLPNTTIPYSVTKEYSLLSEDQTCLEFNVYQTLNPYTHSLSEVSYTGRTGIIDDIPKSISGQPHPINIEFEMDINQLIQIKAYIPTTRQVVGLKFSQTDIRQESEEDFVKATKQVDELWESRSPQQAIVDSNSTSSYQTTEDLTAISDEYEDSDETPLEKRGKAVAAEIGGEKAEKILRQVSKIREARQAGDKTALREEENQLVDLLVDM